MDISIVSCGVYLPFLRIKRDEYLNALGGCSAAMQEKTVMDIDEDVVTMAVEAARDALAGVDTGQVGALVMASTSFPYQEKVMAGTLVEALGLKKSVLTGHHGNSSLAGTEALLAAAGILGRIEEKYALVIVSDAPAAGAADEMEHGFAAAACAFVLAKNEPGLLFESSSAHVSESMGLRYRLPGETGPRDIGVKTYANQAYNDSIKAAVAGLLQKLARQPGDYRHVVLQQNDLKTPATLAKKLGFNEEQYTNGLVFGQVGDTGACSTLLGLCRALDHAAAGDAIIIVSYGAGSGSQATSFRLNAPVAKPGKSLDSLMSHKKYISYVNYLKLKRII